MATYHSMKDVLSVARIHPFYSDDSKYPPSPETIARLLISHGDAQDGENLDTKPLLHKPQLYTTIQRLCADGSPDNGYRLNSYISTTGGGSGKGRPMFFLTDTVENHNQRATTSLLMKASKMIEPSDWVLNLHPSGNFYRALDLTTDMIERAGGNVLCAGYTMPDEKSLAACIEYQINVLTGGASEILSLAHHLASLPSSARSGFKITKIIYTCEMMPLTRREFLVSVFGPVDFYSIFASAETGPWAIANFRWTGEAADGEGADFVFDTRVMNVEVLSLSSAAIEPGHSAAPRDLDWVPEGTAGHLVLTSLQRLRNPLVRYVSGDIGSLHALPASAAAELDSDIATHLKVLRLYGRDQRFSFKWIGEYFEFGKLNQVLQTDGWNILQWQIILRNDDEWENFDACELRLLRRSDGDEEEVLAKEDLVGCLCEVFWLTPPLKRLLKVVFVEDVREFERSETSNKVVRFLDRRV